MIFGARRVRCVIYGTGGSHDLAWANTRWSSEPPPKGFVVSGVQAAVVCWWCVALLPFEMLRLLCAASPSVRQQAPGNGRPRGPRLKIQLPVGGVVYFQRLSSNPPYLTGT
jgi:hypothetical protein